MHRQAGVLVVVLALVTAGVTGVGAAAGATGSASTQMGAAQVTFQNQTTGGATVVVDRVTMPSGGFVAVHDATLTEGETLASVVGSSAYLPAGTHEDVVVQLDEPVSNDATLVAMPHKDTDGDRIYEFVPSQGEVDGPYTQGGDIVLESASVTVSATVSTSDQPTDGDYVTVDSVSLSQDGFVTVHDATLLEGETFDSVRGTTYLPAGEHDNVRVRLDEPLGENGTVVAMPHRDTDGDGTYDFVTSDGSDDGPFLNGDGEIVLTTANVTLNDTASVAYPAQSTGGHSVTVGSVFLPNGGFVTVHDSSLQEGATFDSVRGTSDYLAPGLHRDVTVHLDESLEESDTLVAMPHRDTDGDETYDFVASDGSDDSPYTENGNVVVDTGETTVSASVAIDDQASNGNTVVVETVDLSEPGFVTVHDASLNAGETLGSVRGTSAYLTAGHHHDVEVPLSEPLTTSATVVAMAHQDTNANQQYDFVTSEGANDGPFTSDGNVVLDTARASVNAQTTLLDQRTGGTNVTVRSVTMRDGGFVTVHDATLLEGQTFDSVRGTSAYLAPGTHENVTVTLDDPLASGGTLIAMTHRDTNGNEAYDFVTSEGAADTPYVAGGDIVLDTGNVSLAASVTFEAQSSDGESVTVQRVRVPDGGFVTAHDGTLLDGATFDSVRGTSAYLDAGVHEDVTVTLDDPLEETETVVAMPHRDTDGDETYDFVSSEGAADGPYTQNGDIVLAPAEITVEGDSMDGATDTAMPTDENMDGATDTAMPTDENMDGDTPTDGSSGSGPGFGVVVALLALVAAALLARRD